MGKPQLWVWVGSDDDTLDVMRYARATNEDILSQDVVRDALDTAYVNGRRAMANELRCTLGLNEGLQHRDTE